MKKTVIVTGVSRGLGLALAKKFVQSGHVVLGISKTKKAWAHAKLVINNPKQFILHSINVTQESKVKFFVTHALKAHGKIDILVNAAGYGGRVERVEQITETEFKKSITFNLISQFLMCKYMIPVFRNQKRGVIVNISSMAGKRAIPRLAPYSASKFGVLALSQAIAKENEEVGLKCFSVCPGGMNTSMRANLFGKKDAEKQQNPDFVAGVILNTINGKLKVESGGDIVIRHGKVTVHPAPQA